MLANMGRAFAVLRSKRLADRAFSAALRYDPDNYGARLAKRRLGAARKLSEAETQVVLTRMRAELGNDDAVLLGCAPVTTGSSPSTKALWRLDFDLGPQSEAASVALKIFRARQMQPREIAVARAAQSLDLETIRVPRVLDSFYTASGNHALLWEWIDAGKGAAFEARKVAALAELATLEPGDCRPLGKVLQDGAGGRPLLCETHLEPFEGLLSEDEFDALSGAVDRGLQALADESSAIAALPARIAHGDAHEWNLLADAAGKVAAIDLGRMCVAPAGYDLAALIGYRLRRGRLSAETLPEAEEEAIREFCSAGAAPANHDQAVRLGYAFGALCLAGYWAEKVRWRRDNRQYLVRGMSVERFAQREAVMLQVFISMALRNLRP